MVVGPTHIIYVCRYDHVTDFHMLAHFIFLAHIRTNRRHRHHRQTPSKKSSLTVNKMDNIMMDLHIPLDASLTVSSNNKKDNEESQTGELTVNLLAYNFMDQLQDEV